MEWSLPNTWHREITFSGPLQPNSLAEGERYHKYPRSIYTRVRSDYTFIEKDCILQLALIAVTDTTISGDLVSTLLVFGTLPRLRKPLASDFRNQREWMQAIGVAQKKLSKVMSRRHINSTLEQNVPSATSKIQWNCRLERRTHLTKSSDWKLDGTIYCLRVLWKILSYGR